ncbi:acetyl-CoA synthetase-like protein [Russula earlei]|uniref:Acetyl-CoA synthetase-like protein n=1 Tax=Russula earlei TaxID=71964 RepID=A0ACC0TWS1_9AGAM|nr:acetyl-CoA synthetase-like protein [Russula earlei]
MPHIRTLYPSLPPSTPTVNYYDWLLGHPELIPWPEFTLHIDGVTGEQRSARAVLERLEHAATALSLSPNDGGLGLVAGQRQRVGILSENCLDYPVLAFALLKLAVPMALLPSMSTLQETVALIKLAGITFLFVNEEMHPHAAAAARESGLPEEYVFIIQGHVTGKVSLARLIEHVVARGLPRVPTQPVRDDTLAYLVFSSGTTGLPKGVMISHRNMIFSTAQMVAITEEDEKGKPASETIPVYLAVLPWYHTMGAHAYMFRLFLFPKTLIVLPRWKNDLVVKAFAKYPITHLIMVPSMTYHVVHSPELAKIDLSSLEYAAAGAAYLPPEIRAAFERRAKNLLFFYEGYGLSECTYSAISLPSPGVFGGRVNPLRGMAGILNPSLEARILREDGSDADYNRVGELILRGPTIAQGYWNNKDATKETFKDGWLHTGDRFYVDRQERFFYVDRAKDTFKVSGKQVSPTEIEDALREHPSQFITDVAVAGVKGERLSEELVPRAWVVLSNMGKEKGAEAVLSALDDWTHVRLSKHKWLRGGLQVVDEIPRVPTGKILRRKLQDEYARGGHQGTQTKLQTKL